MITESKRQKLREKLDKISAVEKDKIIYAVRFGLYDGIYRTNEETAKIFSTNTAEGIRLTIQRVEKFFNKK